MGFNIQQVRRATVVKARDGERPGDYAERIGIYNEPDAFAVARAMLEDAAAINPAVPIEATDAARRTAIERLDHTMEQWYKDSQEGSRLQPAGWPGQPTAPGLSAALLRMRRHTQMALLSLDAMTRGPSNKRWGIIDRLAARDAIVFIDAAFEALRLAALIVAETSTGTPAPATNEDRQALKAALDARETGNAGNQRPPRSSSGSSDCQHQRATTTARWSTERQEDLSHMFGIRSLTPARGTPVRGFAR